MTRINSNIKAEKLTDEHLRAEIRELPRIVSKIRTYLDKETNIEFILNKSKNIPEFKLGTGHVMFFYDKIKFLYNRYNSLLEEYRKRYNKNWNKESIITFVSNCVLIELKYPKLYNDWKSSEIDDNIIKNRIKHRLENSKQIPHYYSKAIEKKEAIDLILFE